MSPDHSSAPHKVVLIGGGVRAGKSRFALRLARALGQRRVLIATAEPLDAEMRARIEAHKRERGDQFQTLEEPLALAVAFERAAGTGADVVVIDCLTLWLANLLLRDESEQRVLAAVEALARTVEARRCHTIVVTNEVGMGVVPESALGRAFRDLTGRAHQRLSRAADEIYFAVLGTMLRIRPGPVTVEGNDDAPLE
jgi:adenosylcobinamide kinase/adenosylcobinamide-phosphate guanylyltransferase